MKLNWFKTLLNNLTDGMIVKKKQELLELMSAMVYAKNNDEVYSLFESIKEIPGTIKLVGNLNNNWMNNLEQSVKFYSGDKYE